jgi:hypothetical protein
VFLRALFLSAAVLRNSACHNRSNFYAATRGGAARGEEGSERDFDFQMKIIGVI